MRTTLYAIAIFIGAFGATIATLAWVDPLAQPIAVAPTPAPLFIEVPQPEEAKEPRSYDEALQLARQKGRKLVLMFSGSHCPPCRAMKSSTLEDAGIKKILSEKFVFYIALDDAETNRKFGIGGVPTFFILDENEKVLHRRSGYMDVDEFEKFLSK